MSSENTAHVYPLTIISFAAEAAMLRLPGILALSHATGVRLCSRQLPAQLTAMCFIAGRAGTWNGAWYKEEAPNQKHFLWELLQRVLSKAPGS